MTQLDCPTCHQMYTIPEEMKNHVEQVHTLNRELTRTGYFFLKIEYRNWKQPAWLVPKFASINRIRRELARPITRYYDELKVYE